jgi:hypothetical protein
MFNKKGAIFFKEVQTSVPITHSDSQRLISYILTGFIVGIAQVFFSRRVN